MIKRPNTKAQRVRRHQRVRGKISGTAERPRLSVFRSENNIYAQIIDDVAGKTLCSASTVEKGFEGNGGNCEAAAKIGKLIGERAVAAGITEVEARTQALVSAQSALDATQAGFEVGTRTIVDVLLSQQVLTQAQRDYSNSRHNFLVNTLALKQSAGVIDIKDVEAVNQLLTRDAEGLANALEKLKTYGQPMQKQSSSTANLFMNNPLKPSALSKLFSTHPPLDDRIARLRDAAEKM